MPEIAILELDAVMYNNYRQYGERYIHFKDVNQTDKSL